MAPLLSALLALFVFSGAIVAKPESSVPNCYCASEDWETVNQFVMAACKDITKNLAGPELSCRSDWKTEQGTALVTFAADTIKTTRSNMNTLTSTSNSTPTSASTTAIAPTIAGTASPLTKFNGLSAEVAPFNGVSMFTGSCTSPKLASASGSASADANITAYPWMGCSQEDHKCCAYAGEEPMLLTVCPHDYTTTSSACCPSKWQIYTTDFGGQTPCYTSLETGYTPIPSLPGNMSFISDLTFTMKYDLTTKESSRLGNGAMAGIIIGSIVGGVCFMGALGHLIMRRRRGFKSPPTVLSPSPRPTSVRPDSHAPPLELPGSTFIHENHPAFNPSRLERGPGSGL
ncbi:hypothetical protein FQN54_005788 [Arachnomyces sp. PD_36]|nr:hypothetical protein FQN54_005788 [Arachnomyces sp. PD_36]